jgi:uncharacterized membrane protein YhaH (DUF805 family)
MNDWTAKMSSPYSLFPSLRELLSFRGRLGRGDFFVVLAFPLAAWAATVFLMATNGWYAGHLPRNYSSALAIIDLASPVLLAAATVRRLHDLDRPSWWAIPFLLIPLLAFVAVTEAGRLQLNEIMAGGPVTVACCAAMILFALLWATFLYLMSRKGGGPNRHGPETTDPLLHAVIFLSGLR